MNWDGTLFPVDPCVANGCIKCGYCDQLEMIEDDKERDTRLDRELDLPQPEDFGIEPIPSRAKELRRRFTAENGSSQKRQKSFGFRTERGMIWNDCSWSRQTRDRHQWQRRAQREDIQARALHDLERLENFERELKPEWCKERAPLHLRGDALRKWHRHKECIERTIRLERERQERLLREWKDDSLPVMDGMDPDYAHECEQEHEYECELYYEGRWQNPSIADDITDWDREICRQQERERARQLDWWDCDDDFKSDEQKSWELYYFPRTDACEQYDCFSCSVYDRCYGLLEECIYEEFDPDDPYAHYRRRIQSKGYDELERYDHWLIFCSHRNCNACFRCYECEFAHFNEPAGIYDDDWDDHVPEEWYEDEEPEDYGYDSSVRTGMRSETANRRPHRSKAAYMLKRRRARAARGFRDPYLVQQAIEDARDRDLEREYNETVARETLEEDRSAA